MLLSMEGLELYAIHSNFNVHFMILIFTLEVLEQLAYMYKRKFAIKIRQLTVPFYLPGGNFFWKTGYDHIYQAFRLCLQNMSQNN